MLTFEQIKELIELVATHSLHGVEVERSGFRLRIDGHKTNELPAAAPAPVPLPSGDSVASLPAAPASVVAAAPAQEVAASAPSAGAHILTSPIVGTFYRSPSPDSAPYADVGDRVKKGQVLCIVEAMKLMNEIESDADGMVVEIFPKNAQAVEFGEPLYAIKTD